MNWSERQHHKGVIERFMAANPMPSHAETMEPYRIGWSKRGRKRWRLGYDRWQSECPDVCRFARRGRSPAMALRRMERDVAAALQGRQSAYQRWRWWRARKWDAKNLTPEALGIDGDR